MHKNRGSDALILLLIATSVLLAGCQPRWMPKFGTAKTATEATLTVGTLNSAGIPDHMTPYQWNKAVPEKRPGGNANGKLVLFDVSHGGTNGNADWVIDGAFSDFADALVDAGYRVREYRGVDTNGDGIIQFADDRQAANAARNEAIITFDALQEADVLILAESNRPFTTSERDALKQFVDTGKGIFFISNHYNADRNFNTWDSTEVFNGYNRSSDARYNMGDIYGDLRNPKNAAKGWLSETFGLRFRFNAVDWEPGASEIKSSAQSEGLTQGVTPLLIAAGGTLAIVDGSKAKGLVYFSKTDRVQKWGNSTDQGLYFPGTPEKEGPVAAISKPSAGKAAFIGDSSPIEDQTPKYRRENDGKPKSTRAGWTSPGTASVLALNIVQWLAKPEAYVGFNGTTRTRGIPTPSPMLKIEYSQVGTEPWANPGDFDPWNPETWNPGAYGAQFAHRTGSPNDTLEPILSVSQALDISDGRRLTVKGFIVAPFNDQHGLQLADNAGNPGAKIAVQLPRVQKATFNPMQNPDAIGKLITVSGQRQQYDHEPGIISVSAIEFVH